MDFDAALQAIRESSFSELVEQFKELLIPSMRLRTRRIDVEDLPLGASRMGGVPDWPENTAWPHLDDKPLTFLAQIRVADLREILENQDGGGSGWLYFFYEADKQEAWGFDPKDKEHWKVLYVDCPLDDLSRAPLDTSEPADQLHTCGLSFELEHTLPPSCLASAALELEFTSQEEEAYDELLQRVNGIDEPVHRMFGLPDEIQGDMRLECQLVSNGLYCGNSSGFEDPRAEQLEDGQQEWMLLLQVDTDEDGPGWMWGDCGRLYFWIRGEDLEQGHFDRAWMVLQCY